MNHTKKFSFVILHYITLEDTIKCVESIVKNCKKYDYNIVIVDNGSPNNSGEELISKYSNSKRIKVISSNENLGFAKGNNLGFVYAKNNFNPDFIILCNNDTYLKDEDFCEKIAKEYSKSQFALMGPKIILKDGTLNNVTEANLDIKTLRKQYSKYRMNYFIAKIPPLYGIKQFLKKLLKRGKILSNSKYDPTKRYEDVIIHGAFLIFSKKYIEMFDGLDDRTFLYREEELLYIRIKNNNLKTVYNPAVRIVHSEDSSTNALNKKKDLFVFKNALESTKILINDIEERKYEK